MSRPPLNIAHRGARAHAPENTLAAARLAHQDGADMWELDTCLTRDGHLVVIHDDTLERATNVARLPEFADRSPWRVDAFTLAELRSLDAGSWFAQADPFGTVSSGDIGKTVLASYAGELIPTLEEALLLTRELGWQVNVEIKNHFPYAGHETVARQVADLIRSLGMESSVVLSSFQHEYLRELAGLLPSVPRGALVEKPVKPGDLKRASKAKLAVRKTVSVTEAERMCREASARFFHPDKAFLTDAGYVADIQDNGCLVNVWTVNTEKDMKRMIEFGVHGIITDYPARLRELL